MSLRGALTRPKNTSPVPLVSRYRNYNAQTVGNPDQGYTLAQYGSNGTLFAIVQRLSQATSQVDWKLYRKSESGKKEDREEVTRHPALAVWNKPNNFQPRQEFVESMQQYVDLLGEASWVIAKSGGRPIELWLPRPERIACIPDPKRFISGYVYRSPDGERVTLKTDEVVQVKMPNPLDPYRGLGPVQAMLTHLDSARYSAEWNRNFYVNGAFPGAVLEVDKRLQEDELNEMQSRFDEQHRGISNAHRVLIMENGAVYKPIAQTARDMQFAELSQLSRETIREAFGFPKAMLGTVDDVNRANAEANEVVFARWLIVPRLERIKMALNNDFLPLFGETGKNLEFDYANPVPDDLALENATLTAKVNAVVALIREGADAKSACEAVDLPVITFKEKVEQQEVPQQFPPQQNTFNVGVPHIENAQRWVAKAHIDDSTCEPCSENNGKTYKNREDAFEDYPDGAGYKNCIGAKYGNKCRCTVTKRRKGNDGDAD